MQQDYKVIAAGCLFLTVSVQFPLILATTLTRLLAETSHAWTKTDGQVYVRQRERERAKENSQDKTINKFSNTRLWESNATSLHKQWRNVMYITQVMIHKSMSFIACYMYIIWFRSFIPSNSTTRFFLVQFDDSISLYFVCNSFVDWMALTYDLPWLSCFTSSQTSL